MLSLWICWTSRGDYAAMALVAAREESVARTVAEPWFLHVGVTVDNVIATDRRVEGEEGVIWRSATVRGVEVSP